jgi:hypothetical protein
MTIDDLIFLRKARIAIDEAMADEVRLWENKNRDLSACCECLARPSEQHDPTCPRASILFEPDWFDRVKQAR